jgi:hypothetical protein
LGAAPTKTVIEDVVNSAGGSPDALYVKQPPEFVDMADDAAIGIPLRPYSKYPPLYEQEPLVRAQEIAA